MCLLRITLTVLSSACLVLDLKSAGCNALEPILHSPSCCAILLQLDCHTCLPHLLASVILSPLAAEAEVQQRRSVLTAGRSVSHARLAAALGGGGSRGPMRGAGSGGASGASRGASPRLPMEKVIVFSQVGGAMYKLGLQLPGIAGCAKLSSIRQPPALAASRACSSYAMVFFLALPCRSGPPCWTWLRGRCARRGECSCLCM